MTRLEPFFLKSHGKPRVDDLRVLSGSIYFCRNGLRWRDAPHGVLPGEDPLQLLEALGGKGVFARMMEGQASEATVPKTVMIDVEAVVRHSYENHWRGYLKAHCTASSLRSKKGPRRPKGPSDWRDQRRHEHKAARRRRRGRRPMRFYLTAGQVSDYTGAAALPGRLPKAEWLLADRGYSADWVRDISKDKGGSPCIPGQKSRGRPIKHNRRHYRIEIMFGRPKDGRRVATRYDRCSNVLLSAVDFAAVVMHCL
jgi:transposase